MNEACFRNRWTDPAYLVCDVRNRNLLALVVLGWLLSPAPAATDLEREVFVDPRDGRSYPLVDIAGMTWFGRNLEHAAEGSFCFEDEVDCPELGRLYPWDVALTACPDGWHLSTEDEWQRLEVHLGMASEEIPREKGRGEGIGDLLKAGGGSGLDIPLAGWRRPDGTYAEGNGHDRAAALWTATPADPETAWHRDVSSARSVVWRSPVDEPYGLSVRCVRDEASEP